ncbi:MAG: TolB family protein [Calditrichota bacterium]
MNKWILLVLLFTLALFAGCKDDDGGTEQPYWRMEHLWPRGSKPIPSPVSEALLFVQEETPAGLYLLQNGTAVHLNPSGPAIRSDYAWSQDGLHFAVSSPGEPGQGETGIYTADISAPTQLHKIWDRGSHPRYLPGNEGLICAGPEDGSDSEGIWHYNLSQQVWTRLTDAGSSPEISPDGLKISYLIQGTIWGKSIVVLDRVSSHRDTLGGPVVQYSWLGDSQYLVAESDSGITQFIYTVSAAGGEPLQFFGMGGYPVGLGNGNEFVYVGITGDLLDGLFIASPGGTPTRISDIGTHPATIGGYRIVAQDSTGIIELRYYVPI